MCKKYRIKIKSKKFSNANAKHLDYVNKTKREIWEKSEGQIKGIEKKLLETFNYYKREYKPFSIEKIHRDHKSDECPSESRCRKLLTKYNNRIFEVQKTPKRDKFSKVSYDDDLLAPKEDRENYYFEELKKIIEYNKDFLNFIRTDFSDLQRDLEYLVSFFKRFRDENFQKIYPNTYFFDQFEMVIFNLINILKTDSLLQTASNFGVHLGFQ